MLIEWLYGPNDGQTWETQTTIPEDVPVLVGTTLRSAGGMPLLARYVQGIRSIESGMSYKGKAWLQDQRVFVFDGWYVNIPGDKYGPKTGGLYMGEGR